MTPGEVIAAVSLVLLFFGSIFGVWKYVDSKITSVRTEANKKADASMMSANDALRSLQAHKLHVAENYITKQGLREFRDEILKAIAGIGEDFRHLNGRLDHLHENK